MAKRNSVYEKPPNSVDSLGQAGYRFSTQVMLKFSRLSMGLTAGLLLAGLNTVSAAKNVDAADPKKVDADFKFQGEYAGSLGGQYDVGAQVIALGGGKFKMVLYPGGLPGAGYEGGEKREYDGARDGDTVTFTGGTTGKSISGGKLTFERDGQSFSIDRTIRKSPTLSAKPPEGATVLFDGKSAKNFKPGKMTEDGLLMEGANSVAKFQSHKLHLEFRLPYEPTRRGQGRANSGCYLQARYEVQVLDSFGLAGKHNECGGIYSIKDPDLNMCFPPLQWQTYDIDFTAAKYDKDGKKTANARITVRHNGVLIHDNVELPKRTTASPLAEGPEPGFLHLQDHSNPLRFRNIWVVKK